MSLSPLWAELLSTNPSNDELCSVIEYVPSLRDQAGTQLLAQNPSMSNLLWIIEYVPRLRVLGMQLLPAAEAREKLIQRMCAGS